MMTHICMYLCIEEGGT